MSPPTASTASAISRADHVSVPLKSRCSRKCDAPASDASSSRDPVATQKPAVTERTSGMRSVTTVRPLSSSVDSITRRDRGRYDETGSAPAAPSGVAPGAGIATAAAATRAGAGVGRAQVAELLAGLFLEEVLE